MGHPTAASLDPVPWERRTIEVGDWRITALSDGFLRLDGGSMWGVVPKNLWGKMTPALEDNTILLALRPFLLERGDIKAVIEVGIGDRWEAKWREIYHLEQPVNLEQSLAACGVTPTEVTHVIASHCHFDHIGAMVVERDGALVPAFPKARHHAHVAEIANARNPDHVRRASYRTDDIRAVEEAGLLEGFEGDAELFPGVRAHHAFGHSDGVSVITVNEEEDGDTAIFWADVVPTTHHIQPSFIMAYDIDAVRSFETRSKWLARASEEGWIGLFYHDADHAFGRIGRGTKRYEFEPIAGDGAGETD
jgi:glyoxylase-like metal-dependent hydrolase (beta-lactamase superfamily II)